MYFFAVIQFIDSYIITKSFKNKVMDFKVWRYVMRWSSTLSLMFRIFILTPTFMQKLFNESFNLRFLEHMY